MPSKSNNPKKKINNNSNSNNKKELIFTIQNDRAKEVQNNNQLSPQKPNQNIPQAQSPISPSNQQPQQIPVESVKNIEENKHFVQVEKRDYKEQQNEEEEENDFEEENNQDEQQESNELATVESPMNKGYILVFDDPINYTVKHPLKNKWTFWFDKPSGKNNRSKEWGDHLEKIYTFEYIEDFWRLYNNVPTVSKLANQSNYHLFKEGIVPKWEDPMNENGGRWMFHVEKASRQVDNYFLRAMLACVGEQITSNDDEVCGVVATVKHSEDRISLWCYSTPEESSVTRICGHQFKKLLQVPNECKIYFQTSKDGISGGRAIPSQLNYIV